MKLIDSYKVFYYKVILIKSKSAVPAYNKSSFYAPHNIFEKCS